MDTFTFLWILVIVALICFFYLFLRFYQCDIKCIEYKAIYLERNIDVHKGNLLVLGLVSGLFVASAYQYGCKKRAADRGQSAVSVSSCTEKVDTVSKKVASVAGEMGLSVLIKNNKS